MSIRKTIVTLAVIGGIGSAAADEKRYYMAKNLSANMMATYVLADMCESVTEYNSKQIKGRIERYFSDQTGVFENPINGQLMVAVNLKKQEIEDGNQKEIYKAVCDLQIHNNVVEYNRLSGNWRSIGIKEPPKLDIKLAVM